MHYKFGFVLAIATALCFGQPSNDTVVFKSDVSLVRVDAQVLDGSNHSIANLIAQDFVLRDEGKVREIRNFARENMALDVLILIDVSGSMRPNVERIASASRQAMDVLRDEDRVGIMVFDRQTRIRMPLRKGRESVEQEFQTLLRQEKFKGGTDITRALYDAADYMSRNGRKEARKTIIIVTDDQTESMFQVDEFGVGRALASADTVLNALLAPDAMANRRNFPQQDYPRQGGGQRGGQRGGSRGGVIWPGGGGYPGGGGGYPGGGGGYPGGGSPTNRGGPNTKSAGSAEIAHDSGGDSFPVSDAFALENTLARMRQRYTLFFTSAPDARSGQERNINLELTETIRAKYPNAELRFRRTYKAAAGSGGATEPTYSPVESGSTVSRSEPDRPVMRRRPVADGTGSGPRGPNPALSGPSTPKAQPQIPNEDPPPSIPVPTPAPVTGGWRKVGDPVPAKKEN